MLIANKGNPIWNTTTLLLQSSDSDKSEKKGGHTFNSKTTCAILNCANVNASSLDPCHQKFNQCYEPDINSVNRCKREFIFCSEEETYMAFIKYKHFKFIF